MSDKEGEKFDTSRRCRKTDSSSFFHGAGPRFPYAQNAGAPSFSRSLRGRGS